MATNTRYIDVPPADVWAVLADGWLYPVWVVGATRVRDVEDDWPAVGSKIHHSVGVWPLALDDDTEVDRSEPEHLLSLRARGWPIGEAAVTLRLTEQGAGTEVTIEEDAVTGPGALMPKALRDVAIRIRNIETLKRLAYVVEGRRRVGSGTRG